MDKHTQNNSSVTQYASGNIVFAKQKQYFFAAIKTTLKNNTFSFEKKKELDTQSSDCLLKILSAILVWKKKTS